MVDRPPMITQLIIYPPKIIKWSEISVRRSLSAISDETPSEYRVLALVRIGLNCCNDTSGLGS